MKTICYIRFVLGLMGCAVAWALLPTRPSRVTDGTLNLTSQGGAANLSGIELWKLKP